MKSYKNAKNYFLWKKENLFLILIFLLEFEKIKKEKKSFIYKKIFYLFLFYIIIFFFSFSFFFFFKILYFLEI